MLVNLAALTVFGIFSSWFGHSPVDKFNANPPIHIHKHFSAKPQTAISPLQIKQAYKLSTDPLAGAGKTIAIVDAYDDPNISSDLKTFNAANGLNLFPTCATSSSTTCFQKVKMSSRVRSSTSWGLEESLDVEWAHAVAPGAKILLVEATTAGGNDLLNAVDYARKQAGVASVSMSWGGSEFSGQSGYDSHFTTGNGSPIGFFASSGDNGTGISWPAVSTNVIGVGGTSLVLNSDGTIASETAWSGSGGGISALNTEPSYQSAYGVSSGSKRGVPDVAYDADPATGFPVYDSYGYGWVQVGGTSAGAPQWAAINAIHPVTSSLLYTDAKLSTYFNDVIFGINGTCGPVCSASNGYDFVTGLGSPARNAF